jgi:hypothetical protein
LGFIVFGPTKRSGRQSVRADKRFLHEGFQRQAPERVDSGLGVLQEMRALAVLGSMDESELTKNAHFKLGHDPNGSTRSPEFESGVLFPEV